MPEAMLMSMRGHGDVSGLCSHVNAHGLCCHPGHVDVSGLCYHRGHADVHDSGLPLRAVWGLWSELMLETMLRSEVSAAKREPVDVHGLCSLLKTC